LAESEVFFLKFELNLNGVLYYSGRPTPKMCSVAECIADISDEYVPPSAVDTFVAKFLRNVELQVDLNIRKRDIMHEIHCANTNLYFGFEPVSTVNAIKAVKQAHEHLGRLTNIERAINSGTHAPHALQPDQFAIAVRRIRTVWDVPEPHSDRGTALRCRTFDHIRPMDLDVVERVLCLMLGDSYTVDDLYGWIADDMRAVLYGVDYDGVADLEYEVLKNAVAHEQYARVNDHCIPDLRNIVMSYLED
jgi:hypothetical protein